MTSWTDRIAFAVEGGGSGGGPSLQIRGRACQQIAAIGVLAGVDQLVRRAALDDAAMAQHEHVVGDLAHDRHRGGDEQDAGVDVLAQLLAAAG